MPIGDTDERNQAVCRDCKERRLGRSLQHLSRVSGIIRLSDGCAEKPLHLCMGSRHRAPLAYIPIILLAALKVRVKRPVWLPQRLGRLAALDVSAIGVSVVAGERHQWTARTRQ